MFYAALHSLRSRHPLARLAAVVLGIIVVIALLTIGVFVLAVLAVGGAVFALVRALRAPSMARPAQQSHNAPAGIIDGEFTVVADSGARTRPSPQA
jgi:hypothetical protein